MTEIAGIAHVVLRVEDWKRASRWYQDVLGFERRRGDGFSCFVHPESGFALLLRPCDEATEPSSSPRQRLDHIAMHVPSVAELEVWQRTLASKGIDVTIDHQPSIGASITLHDPDGVEIELFTPSEGSVLEVAPRVAPTG
ncbi:MAG TPA: VOC family protein [Acidimicrobiia bacterium]|nr:VOC family protein [Acidimicrobiia bacterium]